MADPEFNPFNEQGYMKDNILVDRTLEELIYLKAKDYKFKDPGELTKLMHKEEIKRIKNEFNIIINHNEIKHQLKLLKDKNKEQQRQRRKQAQQKA
jgi:hypothetical protein